MNNQTEKFRLYIRELLLFAKLNGNEEAYSLSHLYDTMKFDGWKVRGASQTWRLAEILEELGFHVIPKFSKRNPNLRTSEYASLVPTYDSFNWGKPEKEKYDPWLDLSEELAEARIRLDELIAKREEENRLRVERYNINTTEKYFSQIEIDNITELGIALRAFSGLPKAELEEYLYQFLLESKDSPYLTYEDFMNDYNSIMSDRLEDYFTTLEEELDSGYEFGLSDLIASISYFKSNNQVSFH